MRILFGLIRFIRAWLPLYPTVLYRSPAMCVLDPVPYCLAYLLAALSSTTSCLFIYVCVWQRWTGPDMALLKRCVSWWNCLIVVDCCLFVRSVNGFGFTNLLRFGPIALNRFQHNNNQCPTTLWPIFATGVPGSNLHPLVTTHPGHICSYFVFVWVFDSKKKTLTKVNGSAFNRLIFALLAIWLRLQHSQMNVKNAENKNLILSKMKNLP